MLVHIFDVSAFVADNIRNVVLCVRR